MKFKFKILILIFVCIILLIFSGQAVLSVGKIDPQAAQAASDAVIPASSGPLEITKDLPLEPVISGIPAAAAGPAKPILYLPVVFTSPGLAAPNGLATTEALLSPEAGAVPPEAVEASEAADPALLEFIESIKDPQREGLIVGVYSPEVLAFRVVQQPSSESIFVSVQPDEVTQFRRAKKYGSIGLLAHNYLAGQNFFNLQTGARLYVVAWDGSYQVFEIYAIEDYQALTLYTYKDLASGKSLDQYALFDRVYRGNDDKLTLQTCLEKNGNLSWGRRFVLARPVSEEQ
jgi:hypothetical protein